ncbi:phage tail protein [Fusibacter sp. JL216-2]|uniref:phage tail protein n=1 Tax=Fusibacter sp. JL216-2 TaxID=3071453 RepID=UPI003D3577AF
MDPILGEIQLYAFTFGMQDWARCEGQTLQISSYPALYSLLGAKYGGDGRVTFALPDLRGAEPIPGMAYHIAMKGMFPQRS